MDEWFVNISVSNVYLTSVSFCLDSHTQKPTEVIAPRNQSGGTYSLNKHILAASVAGPGCLSRILIFIHSGSQILDPKRATKERGDKKFVVISFFVDTNIIK